MAYTHDLIVIGAGAAGLTAAGGAAMFGLRTALVEEGAMGGDCLNTGCVPSKALIAAAARTNEAHEGCRLGVTFDPPRPDFAVVMAHVHRTIAALAPADSQERFEKLGVEVIRSRGCFVDGQTIEAGERLLHAPRIVVATGSRPDVPDITGLKDAPYLTNETLWQLESLPRHLAILGAGPVGMEMAQTFRRLGADVTVIERGHPLFRDDPEAVALVKARLQREGVRFETGAEIVQVAHEGRNLSLLSGDGRQIGASHLLVAAGRRANVEDFGLERAGVKIGADGIVVDARRRTSNPTIYAVGDCAEGPRFTHVSSHEGSVALLNIALGFRAKVDFRALPRVTYTDPELAQIGLTEAAARVCFDSVETVHKDFAQNDRAITEGRSEGFIKLVRRRRKLLGVTIVGNHAGDLLLPWGMAIAGKASVFAIGSAIVPYPTRSDLSRAVAFDVYESSIFGLWPKRWARFLANTRR